MENYNDNTKNMHTGKLIFVIQKHDASRLHYDFRLEVNKVLKSWAVPKEPSMDPQVKRLAVLVDDHALEYAGFEGVIPEGRYGAGTVEIWDSGTWHPEKGFEDVNTALQNGLLEFFLEGKKLKGTFTLIRMRKSTVKNGWLLIKKPENI